MTTPEVKVKIRLTDENGNPVDFEEIARTIAIMARMVNARAMVDWRWLFIATVGGIIGALIALTLPVLQ
jgi:hypothetical protein